MLSAIRKKLNSSAGASIVIALIFFLLCAVVGGVVLTAATVSAGRSGRDLSAQRAYLAVSSAARLIENDLEGASFSGAYSSSVTTVTTITQTGVGADGQPTYTTTVTEGPVIYQRGATGWKPGVSQLLDNAGMDLTAIYASRLTDPNARSAFTVGVAADKTCTLEFAENAALHIPAVTALLKVDASYNMTVLLRDASGQCEMLLTLLPAETGPEVSTTVTNSADYSQQTVATAYTTVVTWGPAVASRKGAA